MTTEVKQRNRVTIGSNGKPVFFIDNKIVSQKKYEEVLGPYTLPTPPEGENIVPVCPFCTAEHKESEPSRQKFLNGQKINLCEDHYMSKTTGELAEVLRGV